VLPEPLQPKQLHHLHSHGGAERRRSDDLLSQCFLKRSERGQDLGPSLKRGMPNGGLALTYIPCYVQNGLPWWLSNKESACSCRRHGFEPWVGKILWRRKWQLTPVFLPGKSHGQSSPVGYSPWSCKE